MRRTQKFFCFFKLGIFILSIFFGIPPDCVGRCWLAYQVFLISYSNQQRSLVGNIADWWYTSVYAALADVYFVDVRATPKRPIPTRSDCRVLLPNHLAVSTIHNDIVVLATGIVAVDSNITIEPYAIACADWNDFSPRIGIVHLLLLAKAVCVMLKRSVSPKMMDKNFGKPFWSSFLILL